MKSLSIILCVFLTTGTSFASTSETQPLHFQAWKDQQITEAQNQVLRDSSRVLLIRNTKTQAALAANLPNSKVRNSDPLTSAEKTLRRSQESLEAANSLSFEDYVSIYLPSLRNQMELVAKLAERLSKDELAEIFKLFMRQVSTQDAKRNKPLLDARANDTSSHNY